MLSFIFQYSPLDWNFNALGPLLLQTTNSIKIELFQMAFKPHFDERLQLFIASKPITTQVRIQVAEQVKVAGGQVRTIGRVGEFFEATVTNGSLPTRTL